VTPLSRRTFLVAGAGLVLAACGSSGSSGSSGSPASSGTTTPSGGDSRGSGGEEPAPPAGGLVAIRFFPDGVQPPGSQRMPVGLATSDGALAEDGPATLTARVIDGSGNPVGDPVTAERHDQGLPRAYYPFLTSVPAAGLYTLSIDVGSGTPAPLAFSVTDPAQIAIPQVGDRLVPVDTPTTTDARGVDPICTRDPECPLHERTLTEAMASGKPVAFLIATPAYCQTAACGPVLDVLLSQHDRLGDQVEMVHAEVYINDEPGPDTVSEAVKAYKLEFEPVLYLADAEGVIVERLDSIFDEAEVSAALDRLVA
jgi:hypothetical protein